MTRILCACALLLMFATSAVAAHESKPSARKVTGTTADGEKVTCKLERTVGSNLPRRVCRTQAEMELERELAREQLERDQNDLRR